MSSNISGNNSFIYLGKNTQKDRKLDAEQMKGGIKRENIAKNNNLTDAQKARMLQIFDAIDKNGGYADGILDAEEIKELWGLLTTAAGDEKLNGKDEINTVATALGFDQNDNNTKLTQEELFQFLGDIAEQMEDIESSTIDEGGTITITHKKGENGSQLTEYFYSEGNKTVETTLSTGTVVSQTMNEDGILLNEREVTIDNGVRKETFIRYDAEGKNPVEMTETVGNEIRISEYRDGKPVLTQIKQHLGQDIYKTIDFEYKEDGVIQTIKQDGQPTVHEKWTNIQLPNGSTQTLITARTTEGSPEKTENWDYEQGIKIEWLTDSSGNETRNKYGMFVNDDGKIDYWQNFQTYTDKSTNKKYTVEYDANGNTLGVVVQPRETFEQIAEKYGCDVNELKEANKHLLDSKGRLIPGTEIVIPDKVDAKKFCELQATRRSAADIQRQIAQNTAYDNECKSRVLVKNYNLSKMGWKNKGLLCTKADTENYALCKQHNTSPLKQVALYLYDLEGAESFTPAQLQLRMKQIREDNPDMFDDEGFLIKCPGNNNVASNDISLNLHVNPSYAHRIKLDIADTADEAYLRRQHMIEYTCGNMAYDSWLILGGGNHPRVKGKTINDVLNGKLNTENVATFLEQYRAQGGGTGNFITQFSSKTKPEVAKDTTRTFLNLLSKRCDELGFNFGSAQKLNDAINKFNSGTFDPAELDKIINEVVFDIRKIETVPESKRPEMLEKMQEGMDVDDAEAYHGLLTVTKISVDNADGILNDVNRGMFETFYDWISSNDEVINGDIADFRERYKAAEALYTTKGPEAYFDELKNLFGANTVESLKQYNALYAQKCFIGIYNKARALTPHGSQVENRTEEQLVDDLMAFAEPMKLQNMLGLTDVNKVKATLETLDKTTLRKIIDEYVDWARELSGGRTSDAGIDEELDKLYEDIIGDDTSILSRAIRHSSNRNNFATLCKGTITAIAAAAASCTGVGLGLGALIVGGTSFGLKAADHSFKNHNRGLGWGLTLEQWGDATLNGVVDGAIFYFGGMYGKFVNGAPLTSNVIKSTITNGLAATAGDAAKAWSHNNLGRHEGEDYDSLSVRGVVGNFLMAGAGTYVSVKTSSGFVRDGIYYEPAQLPSSKMSFKERVAEFGDKFVGSEANLQQQTASDVVHGGNYEFTLPSNQFNFSYQALLSNQEFSNSAALLYASYLNSQLVQ